MKIIKILLIAFLVLVAILAIGIFVFIKSFDINQYKSQMTRSLSKALGREVTVKKLGFNISVESGITMDVNGLVVPSQSVAKSNQNIDYSFEIPTIRLNIDLRELLARKEIVISHVHVVNGTVMLMFPGTHPTMRIPLLNLDVQIFDLSLTKAFSVKFLCSLWSEKNNISADGLMRIDAKNKKVFLEKGRLAIDLTELSFDRLKETIPALQAMDIDGPLQGKVSMSMDQMVAGERGLIVLSAKGELNDGQVKLKAIAAPIKNIFARFDVSESMINLRQLSMSLGSGTIEGKGDYSTTKKIHADVEFKKIPLSAILPRSKMPVEMIGEIEGKFTGATMEESDPSFLGNGTWEVKNAKLLNVNVLKIILDKIALVPNLEGVDVSQEIDKKITEHYREKLRQPDTNFKKIALETQIRSGRLLINKAMIEADEFRVLAEGSLDFAQNLDWDMTAYIPEDLASIIVLSVAPLADLLDEQRELRVPFKHYNGLLSHAKIYPDMQYLGKKIMMGTGKSELKKVIFKALKLGTDSNNQTSDGTSTATEEKQRPEAVIIEKVLDSIFK